jgi:hypothetical protein
MNQKQENVTTMFEATLKFLDENNGIWSGTAAFATGVIDAKNGVQAIRDAAATPGVAMGGITDDKQQKRDDLEGHTLEIADQLAALAAKNSNMDLAAKAQMTNSSLDQMQDDDLVQMAQRIASLATSNIAALAAYGVTAART